METIYGLIIFLYVRRNVVCVKCVSDSVIASFLASNYTLCNKIEIKLLFIASILTYQIFIKQMQLYFVNNYI